jgi:hypothetical protein
MVSRVFYGAGGSGGPPGRRVESWPEDFGAKCDGRAVTGVSITESSAVLTAAGAAFTAADVGKTISVYGAGLTAHGLALVTTVLSYQSATQVTLATAAAGTVAGSRAVLGTDDAAAIEAAIADAVDRAIDSGAYSATVWFSDGIYVVARAPQIGGAYNSHAQIRIPPQPDTEQKVILQLRSHTHSGTFGHWLQETPQRAGAVLYSTHVGGVSDGTYGAPCILAGPTPTAAAWSNMLIVIDGLQIVAQRNPSVTAVHLGRVGQMHIRQLGICADMTPAQMNAARPTNDLGLGLRVPGFGNNHYVQIDRYSCEGFYYGSTVSDHLTAGTMVMVYTNTALFGLTGGAAEHGMTIDNLGVEASATILEFISSSDGRFPITINQCNIETSTDVEFKDPNNSLAGVIYFTDNTRAVPQTTGCQNVKLIDNIRRPGAVSVGETPAIPATTVAYRNPFWRDAFVHIASGTVTGIAVDGRTLGVTSGLVSVPTGRTITLTYSVAPTWVWTLL